MGATTADSDTPTANRTRAIRPLLSITTAQRRRREAMT
jgi:hypothetical protein